jgi:hypothetical protein
MTRIPQQLDLFDPPLTQLPPCGRGGPCLAVAENGNWRCVTCGSVAPCKGPRGTIFDGFIRSQLRLIEFLREQAIAPGDPGNPE